METTETPTDPPSEKTKAIQAMLAQMQDITAEVQAIHKIMKANESWRSALWRGLKHFIGLLEGEQKNNHKDEPTHCTKCNELVSGSICGNCGTRR